MVLDKQNESLLGKHGMEDFIIETRGRVDSIKNEILSDSYTVDWYIFALNFLLQKIEDIKENMKKSKKGLSKNGKTVMKKTKSKLEKYEKQIKLKKETLLKGGNVNIYDEDIVFAKNLMMEIDILKMNVWVDHGWLDKQH